MKPALTPEQWAVFRRYGLWGANDAHLYTPEEGRTEFIGPQGVGAAALHDRPFGFTWADVDMLDYLAKSTYDKFAGFDYASLRNRIAALLPPREG
jgi:hypothetical protein